ncbi:MAG: hypothetical protein HYX53_11180 [Chloroflexi bacterium]|nr:hypothetical protein [Chloroflexota bacterium]
MGHRKLRKRERRAAYEAGLLDPGFATPKIREPIPDDVYAELSALGDDAFAAYSLENLLRTGTRVKTCGQCREFVEDAEGGRGSCLHPGSGIAFPWTDTPGCPFYAGRGHR